MTASAPTPPAEEQPLSAPPAPVDPERWPHPLRRFWWDLLPGWLPDRWVPRAGGLRIQPYTPPDWLKDQTFNTPEALEQAKRGHDLAIARVQTVETKADRLAHRALALLAFAFALGGWELRISNDHGGGWWYLLLAPAITAITALAIATVMALELDRPGLFYTPKAATLPGRTDLVRALVEAEERARHRATWTAEHKYDDFLAARAWFSRGLLALIVAGAIAALGLDVDQPTSEAAKPAPTTVSSTTPSQTTTTRPVPGRPGLRNDECIRI